MALTDGRLCGPPLPPCRLCQQTYQNQRRLVSIAVAAGKGFGKVQEKEVMKEKKGKKGQKQGSGSGLQTIQQTRSPEERFRMKQEAQAQGVQEPDAAFEQRLEALRKNAKSRPQSSAGSGGPGSSEARSVLDAVPDFSAAPLEQGGRARQRMQQQSVQQGAGQDSPTNSGPNQALLGAGAVILALVFVITSLGGDGPSSSERQPPGQQERRLGDEERANLEKQVSELGGQIAAGSASTELLQQAASSYAALGRSQEAAGVLEQLVEKEPASSSAWGMLADMRQNLGDYRSADTAYKRAIAEAPAADLGLLEGLCESLVAQGRQKEAVEFLQTQQQTLEGDTGTSKVTAVEVQLLMGKVYSQWDRHDGDAMAVFDGLTQKNPEDFRGYLAKGVLLRKEGRKGDAQRAFLQARYNAPPEALSLIERVISSGSR